MVEELGCVRLGVVQRSLQRLELRMRKPLVLHSLLIQEVIAGGVIIFAIFEHLNVLRKTTSVEALLIKVGRGLGLDDGVVHTREYIALRLAVNSKTRIIFVKSIIFISVATKNGMG